MASAVFDGERRRARLAHELHETGDLGARGLPAAGRDPVVAPPRIVATGALPLVELLDQPVVEHALEGAVERAGAEAQRAVGADRKSTRLNSSHTVISYAVFCLKKK